jgi:hypothetical protein
MAYAAYGLRKPTSLAQPQQRSSAARSLGGSKFTGKYDGLNFGNGGVAVTYGGFTIGGNIIGGRISSAVLAPCRRTGLANWPI